MIKNIIFDLGNVLLNFKSLEYLKEKGIVDNKLQEVHDEIFGSEQWAMLDRGTITEEDAIDILCKRSKGNSELIKLAMNNWYEILTPIEGSIQILKDIKNAGYKTYVLSNFHLLAYKSVIEKYEFFDYFDGGVISYKENLLKPEEDIYQRLIKRYDMNVEETIFIDDTTANIDGARRVGINGIVFRNPEALRDELLRYDIKF